LGPVNNPKSNLVVFPSPPVLIVLELRMIGGIQLLFKMIAAMAKGRPRIRTLMLRTIVVTQWSIAMFVVMILKKVRD
jgi:hypothetical protein